MLTFESIEGLLEVGFEDERDFFKDFAHPLLVLDSLFFLELFKELLNGMKGLSDFDSFAKPLHFVEGLRGVFFDLGISQDLVIFVMSKDEAGGADAFVVIDAEVLLGFLVLSTHLHVWTQVIQETQNHLVDWVVGELLLIFVGKFALEALEGRRVFERRRDATSAKRVSAFGEDSGYALEFVEALQAI